MYKASLEAYASVHILGPLQDNKPITKMKYTCRQLHACTVYADALRVANRTGCVHTITAYQSAGLGRTNVSSVRKAISSSSHASPAADMVMCVSFFAHCQT